MTYWVIEALMHGQTKYAYKIGELCNSYELIFIHDIKGAIRFADEASACKVAQGLGFDYYKATEHKDV